MAGPALQGREAVNIEYLFMAPLVLGIYFILCWLYCSCCKIVQLKLIVLLQKE